MEERAKVLMVRYAEQAGKLLRHEEYDLDCTSDLLLEEFGIFAQVRGTQGDPDGAQAVFYAGRDAWREGKAPFEVLKTPAEKVPALPVEVYSNAMLRQCANGGPTQRYDRLYVKCDKGPLEVHADDERLLVMGTVEFGGAVHAHLKPAAGEKDGKWYSMGGNYAGTSDSRFADMVEALTGVRTSILPVHDRHEGR